MVAMMVMRIFAAREKRRMEKEKQSWLRLRKERMTLIYAASDTAAKTAHRCPHTRTDSHFDLPIWQALLLVPTVTQGHASRGFLILIQNGCWQQISGAERVAQVNTSSNCLSEIIESAWPSGCSRLVAQAEAPWRRFPWWALNPKRGSNCEALRSTPGKLTSMEHLHPK
jgi:hypothetical protein